jgi:hypothetical protein
MKPPSNLPPGVTDRMIEEQAGAVVTFRPGDRVRLTRPFFAAERKTIVFSADELYDLVRGVTVLRLYDDGVVVAAGDHEMEVWAGYVELDQ